MIIANWAFNAYYIDNINIDFDTLEPVIYQVKLVQDKSELDLYYKRLLHINKDYILKTITSVNGLKQIGDSNSGLNHCDSYYSGKFTRTYSHELLKSNTIFDIIDIDIAGPFNTIGIKGERYFITITDRASRAIWVYPLKFKSEVLEVLVSFYNLIIAQFKTNIKAIRLDNVKEFRSNKWTLFTTNKGIICEYTSPYIPNQIGISERPNRFIVERLITISLEKNIPIKLWPYLVQAIAYIKNRTYSPIINKTPYKAIYGSKPYIGYIKILGSLAYILEPKEKRASRFAPKANKGILIGYRSSRNFIVYIPSTDQVVDTANIAIKEDLIYRDDYKTDEDLSTLLEETSPDSDYMRKRTSTVVADDFERLPAPSRTLTLRSSGLSQNQGSRSGLNENREPSIDELNQDFKQDQANLASSIYGLASIAYAGSLNKEKDQIDQESPPDLIFQEPKSYKEAINSDYKDHWLRSMKTELDTLSTNNTWDLVSLPNGVKPLKTRWAYKIKNPKNSTTISDVTFKSRFVAKGFEQLYGLDYIETFASVIKQMAWKLVFALAILNNWLIYKIDMVSAFTNGNIDSFIYLVQLEGFLDPTYPDYVLKLNKALYGLKQSARIWFYILKEVLVQLGFKPLTSDNCIYINTDIIIYIYMDDLAIVAPSLELITGFISQIKKYFNIKELGLIKDYLGIDIDFKPNQSLKLS